MTKPAPRTHYWTQTRVRLLCNLGDHHVPPGTWVRYRKGDHLRAGSCEACLAARGVKSPGSFTFHDDKPDVRTRQAGGDE